MVASNACAARAKSFLRGRWGTCSSARRARRPRRTCPRGACGRSIPTLLSSAFNGSSVVTAASRRGAIGATTLISSACFLHRNLPAVHSQGVMYKSKLKGELIEAEGVGLNPAINPVVYTDE